MSTADVEQHAHWLLDGVSNHHLPNIDPIDNQQTDLALNRLGGLFGPYVYCRMGSAGQAWTAYPVGEPGLASATTHQYYRIPTEWVFKRMVTPAHPLLVKYLRLLDRLMTLPWHHNAYDATKDDRWMVITDDRGPCGDDATTTSICMQIIKALQETGVDLLLMDLTTPVLFLGDPQLRIFVETNRRARVGGVLLGDSHLPSVRITTPANVIPHPRRIVPQVLANRYTQEWKDQAEVVTVLWETVALGEEGHPAASQVSTYSPSTRISTIQRIEAGVKAGGIQDVLRTIVQTAYLYTITTYMQVFTEWFYAIDPFQTGQGMASDLNVFKPQVFNFPGVHKLNDAVVVNPASSYLIVTSIDRITNTHAIFEPMNYKDLYISSKRLDFTNPPNIFRGDNERATINRRGMKMILVNLRENAEQMHGHFLVASRAIALFDHRKLSKLRGSVDKTAKHIAPVLDELLDNAPFPLYLPFLVFLTYELTLPTQHGRFLRTLRLLVECYPYLSQKHKNNAGAVYRYTLRQITDILGLCVPNPELEMQHVMKGNADTRILRCILLSMKNSDPSLLEQPVLVHFLWDAYVAPLNPFSTAYERLALPAGISPQAQLAQLADDAVPSLSFDGDLHGQLIDLVYNKDIRRHAILALCTENDAFLCWETNTGRHIKDCDVPFRGIGGPNLVGLVAGPFASSDQQDTALMRVMCTNGLFKASVLTKGAPTSALTWSVPVFRGTTFEVVRWVFTATPSDALRIIGIGRDRIFSVVYEKQTMHLEQALLYNQFVVSACATRGESLVVVCTTKVQQALVYEVNVRVLGNALKTHTRPRWEQFNTQGMTTGFKGNIDAVSVTVDYPSNARTIHLGTISEIKGSAEIKRAQVLNDPHLGLLVHSYPDFIVQKTTGLPVLGRKWDGDVVMVNANGEYFVGWETPASVRIAENNSKIVYVDEMDGGRAVVVARKGNTWSVAIGDI